MVRCKVVCNSVTKIHNRHDPETFLWSVDFSFVSGANSVENHRFWEATPSGTFNMMYTKEMPFEPGLSYYIDLLVAPT